MTINEYQKLAMRTAPKRFENREEMLLNGVMGLCGEAGEALEILKKVRYQGHKMDWRHVERELGDAAWYLAMCASACGRPLESILEMNIEKLRRRYPNGFSAEKSEHRAEGDL